MAAMDDSGLLLQVLERIEAKLDAQDEKIMHNTLGIKKVCESLDKRVSLVERDVQWHKKWITGATTTILATISGLAGWLWLHISR